jgi:ABC-type transport system substrate-binding protein
VDRLFVAQRIELDPARREDLLKQAIRILQQDPPFLPLVTFNQVSGYRRDVQGILKFTPDGDWAPLDLIYRTT